MKTVGTSNIEYSLALVEKVIQISSFPWHHCLRWVTGVTCPREISMILSVSHFALSTSPHILDSGSSTISQVNVREDDTNDDAESCCLSLSCITWTWQLQSVRLCHCEEQWKWHWRAVMMTLVRMPVMMMMGVTTPEMRAAETSAEC